MLAQLIPQVFYDFIGRLVPGLALIGTACLLWHRDLAAPLAALAGLVASSSLLALGALLLAAYVASILLEGLWALTLASVVEPLHAPRQREAREHALRDFAVLDPGFEREGFELPGVPMLYDVVRCKNPVVGANVVKLRAESQLYRTLLLGWLLLDLGLVVDLLLRGWTPVRLAAVVALALAAGCTFRLYLERQGRLVWSLYNHWLLLVHPGMP
jgi:hypothetical protein